LPDNDSYCDLDHVLHEFDLSILDQKKEYCTYCAAEDDACGDFRLCRAGDGACPLSCTPSNDADCACNADAKNGYCPASCNENTDADCKVDYPLVCGDGYVFKPFESCEPGPPSGQALKPGQVSYCSGSSCVNCNCVNNNKCGNGAVDPGEDCDCGIDGWCADGSRCTGCKLATTCSVAAKKPVLNADYEAANERIVLKWAVSADCMPDDFSVFYCSRSGTASCTPDSSVVDHTSEREFVFSSVTPLTNYRFVAIAHYSNPGADVDSAVVSVKTGDERCLNEEPQYQFCVEQKVSKCEDGVVKTIEDCATKSMFCAENAWHQASCYASDGCSLCNGLYGSFGKYLPLSVLLESTTYWCSDNEPLLSGCYFDKTRQLFKAYRSCGSVKSCYDLKSRDACEAGVCSFTRDSCEWATIPTIPSIGGVCRPKDSALQDCALCDNPEYNWLSPICTPEACGLFGACYYQGAESKIKCASNSVTSCKTYASEDKCVGFGTNSRDVRLDVTYNSSRSRIGGSNAVTQGSADEFGLGKCFWLPGFGCLRDADGLRADPSIGGDMGLDCGNADFKCEGDFGAPITSVNVTSPSQASPKIYYRVTDSVYDASAIQTFFCIVPSSSPRCYPDELGSSSGYMKYYQSNTLDVSNTYTLYYYSMDPAKNLEEIKNVSLVVDADIPFIDLLYPTTEGAFAVSSVNVSVYGRTDLDVWRICANNTAIKKGVCIKKCGLVGASNPPFCINNDGYFNMTIPVANAGTTGSASTPRNILFEAEDFAHNTYRNTLLGILYDIVPPSHPTIVVK
jgi:hypothetical protein